MKIGKESVVITGCGWVTPFAAGSISEVLTAAALSRRLEPARMTARAKARGSEGNEAFQAVPNEWVNDYPDLSDEVKLDKGAWMTAVALEHACQSASLEPESLEGERVGLVLGCGLAGQLGMIDFACEVRRQSPRFVSPLHFPQTVGNYVAGALARSYGIRGPNVTLASGAASGLDAIIEACGLLLAGSADVVFASGTERLSNALAEGLNEPGAQATGGTSTASEVPLSEGACLFVLERANNATARAARVLATVTGSGRVTHRFSGGASPTAKAVGHPAQTEARSSLIVSVAGCRYPGAVFIEHWIGRCLGAAGAAAVGAAIGAADKWVVPVIDETEADPASVSERQIPVDDLRAPDGPLRAVIVAETDPQGQTHRSTLELTIPG